MSGLTWLLLVCTGISTPIAVVAGRIKEHDDSGTWEFFECIFGVFAMIFGAMLVGSLFLMTPWGQAISEWAEGDPPQPSPYETHCTELRGIYEKDSYSSGKVVLTDHYCILPDGTGGVKRVQLDIGE